MLTKIICIAILIALIAIVIWVIYSEEDDVVSCKDCKWYNSRGYREHWLREVDEDDFCSYQERRESGYEEEWRKWDAPSPKETPIVNANCVGVIANLYPCDTCVHDCDDWDCEACDPCSKAHSNYKPKTEPQADDLIRQADEMIKFDKEPLQMDEEQTEEWICPNCGNIVVYSTYCKQCGCRKPRYRKGASK
jgi:hypothetical protein